MNDREIKYIRRCKISFILRYDYSEIINELLEELKDGILHENDNIQILRKMLEEAPEYQPIIDWYFDVAIEKSL